MKIPFTLHSFNADITHYKNPGQSINVELSPIWEQMWDAAYSDAAAYNNDGMAINQVSAIMNKYAADGRRVMFVMSDGYPAEDGEGFNYPLDREIDIALRQGIELVGVGIGTNHEVDKFYPTSAIAANVNELPTVLLKTLKKALKRH